MLGANRTQWCEQHIQRRGGVETRERTIVVHTHDPCFRHDYGGSQLCVQQLIREPCFGLKRKRLSFFPSVLYSASLECHELQLPTPPVLKVGDFGDTEVHVACVESSQLQNVRLFPLPVRRPKPSRRILGACCLRRGWSPEDSRGTGILQCCTLRALEVSGRWSSHRARELESGVTKSSRVPNEGLRYAWCTMFKDKRYELPEGNVSSL